MRNKGFTVIEAIWAIAILGTIIAMYQVFNTKLYTIRKAKDLAELTQFYAKTYGQYLNDMEESTLYAMKDATHCARINPFINNSTEYYTIGEKDLVTPKFGKVIDKKADDILCQQLDGNYWNETVTGVNDYKQVPCVATTRLPDGKLQALLYWANTPQSIKVPQVIARSSIAYMDGAGAYVESTGTSKGSANFSVAMNNPLFTTQATSCSGKIGNNSIVFDMSGYIPSNNRISKSYKLGRKKDFDHNPNTPDNKNTAQTNIYMNGNKIVFDEQNSLQVQGDKAVLSGRLTNANPMPLESVDSYTSCTDDDIGTIKRQKDESLRQYGAMQYGSEVCTKAPVICGVYQPGVQNCYLPTKTNTVVYSDKTHIGKLGSTALCPNLLPVLRSATVWQKEPGSNPTQQYRYTQAGGYNIPRGVNAIADNSGLCEKWQFNITVPSSFVGNACNPKTATYTCNAGNNEKVTICSNRKLATTNLPCDGKSTNGGANTWKCVQQAVSKAYIETMVCSSKYYVEQQ